MTGSGLVCDIIFIILAYVVFVQTGETGFAGISKGNCGRGRRKT